MLNTIVAESLDYIATQAGERDVKGGKDLNKAIQELLPGIIKESKKVIFNGDNYAEEWHKEAEKRGLPNLRNTVDCLPVITRKDTIELFTKYKVYSEKRAAEPLQHPRRELRQDGQHRGATPTAMMAKTMILPAALRYQKEVGEAIAAAKAAGVAQPAGLETFGTLVGDDQRVAGRRSRRWRRPPATTPTATPTPTPSTCASTCSRRWPTLRTAGDKLETMVADDLWPLPTYREMLFIR